MSMGVAVKEWLKDQDFIFWQGRNRERMQKEMFLNPQPT